MTPTDDLPLKKLRAALEKIYGERLERFVLYGSRARATILEKDTLDNS